MANTNPAPVVRSSANLHQFMQPIVRENTEPYSKFDNDDQTAGIFGHNFGQETSNANVRTNQNSSGTSLKADALGVPANPLNTNLSSNLPLFGGPITDSSRPQMNPVKRFLKKLESLGMMPANENKIKRRKIAQQQAEIDSKANIDIIQDDNDLSNGKTAGPSILGPTTTTSTKSNADTAHLYVFTNEKNAAFNKDLQLAVIEELSKNSAHRIHAEEQDVKLQERIDKLVGKAEHLQRVSGAIKRVHEANEKAKKSDEAKKNDVRTEAFVRYDGINLRPDILQQFHNFGRTETEADRLKSLSNSASMKNNLVDPLLLLEQNADSFLDNYKREFEEELKPRFCCVLDMDMFYAAVELRDRPELKDKPVAVGGIGMLSTSNYVARKYGVRAAMPGFIGVELCRRQGAELIMIPNDHEKYKRVSEEEIQPIVRRMVNGNGENIELAGDGGEKESLHENNNSDDDIVDQSQKAQVPDSNEKDYVKVPSLDEMYIELREELLESERARVKIDGDGKFDGMVIRNRRSLSMWELAEHFVNRMRAEVKEKTGLTCSAGMGPSFMLAKMAADERKPDGQFLVPIKGIINFEKKDINKDSLDFNKPESFKNTLVDWLRAKSVRSLWGVGKVTQRVLSKMGIGTVQDLYDKRGLIFGVFVLNSNKNTNAHGDRSAALHQPILDSHGSIAAMDLHILTNLAAESDLIQEPSKTAEFLVLASHGLPVVREEQQHQKSVSSETTFSMGGKSLTLTDYRDVIKRCSAEVAQQMLNADKGPGHALEGKTVTVKLKTTKFQVRQNGKTLQQGYINDKESIEKIALDLFESGYVENGKLSQEKLRLLGVKMSNLRKAQTDLTE